MVILIPNSPLEALLTTKSMFLVPDLSDATILGRDRSRPESNVHREAVYHTHNSIGSSRTDRIPLTLYSQTFLASA